MLENRAGISMELLVCNPLYYLAKAVPCLNRFVDDYVKEFGPADRFTRRCSRILKRRIRRNEAVDFLSLGNGRILSHLKRHGYKRLSLYDMNVKKLNYVRRARLEIECHHIRDLFFEGAGNVIIAEYVLNSISPERKEALVKRLSERYQKCIFCGDVCIRERPALGPDPVGTYGCRQYTTTGDLQLLKKYFSYVEEVVDPKSERYFYMAYSDKGRV